jgi:hypothetical protein
METTTKPATLTELCLMEIQASGPVTLEHLVEYCREQYTGKSTVNESTIQFCMSNLPPNMLHVEMNAYGCMTFELA